MDAIDFLEWVLPHALRPEDSEFILELLFELQKEREQNGGKE